MNLKKCREDLIDMSTFECIKNKIQGFETTRARCFKFMSVFPLY